MRWFSARWEWKVLGFRNGSVWEKHEKNPPTSQSCGWNVIRFWNPPLWISSNMTRSRTREEQLGSNPRPRRPRVCDQGFNVSTFKYKQMSAGCEPVSDESTLIKLISCSHRCSHHFWFPSPSLDQSWFLNWSWIRKSTRSATPIIYVSDSNVTALSFTSRCLGFAVVFVEPYADLIKTFFVIFLANERTKIQTWKSSILDGEIIGPGAEKVNRSAPCTNNQINNNYVLYLYSQWVSQNPGFWVETADVRSKYSPAVKRRYWFMSLKTSLLLRLLLCLDVILVRNHTNTSCSSWWSCYRAVW